MKELLLIIVFISTLVLLFSRSVYAQGLAGYWSFDDCTATDSSGNNNNGVITGATCVDGKINKALNFNGNSYLEAPNSPTLNISSQVTIIAWINVSSISSYNRIIAKSHTSNVNPYTMYGLMFDNANHIRLEITTSGTQNAVNGITIIPNNIWTFVAGTYDGSSMKVYVNGNLDNSSSHTGGIDTNIMPLSIGRSGFGLDYFIGTIDEVRIYNRSLSDNEIKSIFSEGNNNLICGRLINKTGSSVHATISADSLSNTTDSYGNYFLYVTPGVYDLKYEILDFIISNFYIKLPSLNINSNLMDPINSVSQYPSQNNLFNISFSFDNTKSKIVNTYSSYKPNRVIIDGTTTTEVFSLSQLRNYTWLYNSTENRLYINSTYVQPFQPRCSDGTQYGKCNNSYKPKYCKNGVLIDNCSYCGCNSGYNCLTNGSCNATVNTGPIIPPPNDYCYHAAFVSLNDGNLPLTVPDVTTAINYFVNVTGKGILLYNDQAALCIGEDFYMCDPTSGPYDLGPLIDSGLIKALMIDIFPADRNTIETDSTTVQNIANGQWDSYITTIANQAKAFARPLFFRIGSEMNIAQGPASYEGAYSFGINASAYVAAYKRIVDIFRSQGASNVYFVWNPLYISLGPNPTDAYYPGDSYVDWVGIDMYQDYPGMDPNAQMLPLYNLYSSRKPIMILEWGINQGWNTNDAESEPYVTDFFNAIETKSAIKMIIYQYDIPWHSFDSTSRPSTTATYINRITNPRYIF